MLDREQLEEMTPQLLRDDVLGIAVVGSYARGDATAYSDVDVITLLAPQSQPTDEPSIDLYHGIYRVVQYRTEAQMRKSLTDPARAVYNVIGLQQMLILYDPLGVLRKIQWEAERFVWDETMTAKADFVLNREMLAWQEECYKAMSGLLHKQEGHMLLGLYGLTYGLVRLMLIAKGVLLESENAFFEELKFAYETEPQGVELVEMMRLAFGLDDCFPLLQRVETGLLLYLQFAEYLGERLTPEVRLHCQRVQQKLADLFDRSVESQADPLTGESF
jgi:predicted nucleotidyltransferase